MVDIRTVSLPGIWAEDAQTTIPTPPIANTTYRNLEWGETEANQGWPFQKIVDSADFNQAMWYLFTLQQMQEQFGILPWCSTTAYKQNGICLGSDGIFYWAKSDNTGVNPVNDTGMTTWGIFLDPGDNFVTETVLMNQINLCEKLANKVQALSASSTTTQYPSAKCVYDNINNLASTKQNNITGGASTITTSNLTTNRALISDGNGKVAVSAVTNTELGYLDGVTSNIQTQLNGKQASGSYMTISGNQAVTGRKTFVQSTIFDEELWLVDTTGKAPDNPPSQTESYGTIRWIVKGEEGSTAGYGGGQELFRIQPFINTLGRINVNFSYSYISPISNILTLGCNADGSNVYVTVPAPATTDNSNKAATTAFVNSFFNTAGRVTSKCVPNYAAGVGIGTGTSVIPKASVLIITPSQPNYANLTVTVNGVNVFSYSGDEYLTLYKVPILVPANATVVITGNLSNATYYPLVGA